MCTIPITMNETACLSRTLQCWLAELPSHALSDKNKQECKIDLAGSPKVPLSYMTGHLRAIANVCTADSNRLL